MEKIVCYSRVSTTDQNFESQFDDLRKWAINNDYEVVEVFGEKKSGFDITVERLQYDAMKKYVIDNNIKLIAIWELSRLGRNTLHTLTEIEYFRKLNVDIYFKKENIHTLAGGPTTELLLQILSSVAQLERSSIVERSARGRMSAAMNGKAVNYGVLPYGYEKSSECKLIVNDKEAKIVKDIYDMAIKGIAIRRIAMTLNSKGILTRHTLNGRTHITNKGDEVKILWAGNVIRRMLHNPIYKGERKFRDINLKIPAIITIDQWNKVQERFEEHTGYRNRSKYQYLLKGKMRCGHCGRSYVSYTTSKKSVYLCGGRNEEVISCKAGQFSREFIDDYIWYALFGNMGVLSNAALHYKKNFKIDEAYSEIKFHQDEIIKLEKKRIKNIKLYKEDEIEEKEYKQDAKSIKDAIIEHNNQIKFLEDYLKKDKNPKNWLSYISDIEISNDYNVRRNFVENIIKEITVYNINKTVNIKFEKPLRKDDKIIYMVINTYRNIKPLEMVFTNKSKNVMVSNKLRQLIYFPEIAYLRQE